MANRSGKISLPFGDDTHVFKLGYGQLKELQDTVDAGPFVIENYPIQANVLIAAAILNAALMGAPEEEVGKKNETAGAKTSRRSKTGKSASHSYTEPEP